MGREMITVFPIVLGDDKAVERFLNKDASMVLVLIGEASMVRAVLNSRIKVIIIRAIMRLFLAKKIGIMCLVNDALTGRKLCNVDGSRWSSSLTYLLYNISGKRLVTE